MIQLIGGYRRTGKDTLVRMLNGEESFNWLVYKNSDNKNKFQINRCKRIGFSDKLRQEVDDFLNISSNVSDYDTFKETIIKDSKTYRDFLIEHAAYRRNQDINYWIKVATDWNNVKENEIISITDWRYPNEVNYLKSLGLNVITIRVFRSNVPIPSKDVTSEHQLDDILSDYLLVLSPEEFEKACKIFPQYSNYVLQT